MHPRTISLDEYEISIDPEVRQFLTDQYLPSHYQDIDAVQEYIDRFLESLKQAPQTSMFRINFCLASAVEKVMEDLRCHFKQNWKEGSVHLRISDHFSDVIEIHVNACDVTSIHTPGAVATMTATSDANSQLSHCTVPEPSQSYPILFSHWPRRRQFGWPMTHRIVLCDRFCAEAVLRGSHVFIPGILCTDNAIEAGETVAVYGYMGRDSSKPTRGGTLEQKEVRGLCLFLGLGLAHENREQLVAPNGHGLGVYMTLSRAGTILPPLDRLGNLGMLQNLPSIAVAHALDAQPGHIILDMCSAPGGKTTHLASLTRGKSFIIACDKSQSKVHKMKQLVETMGATHCISVIPLDTTKCIDDDHDNGTCVLDIVRKELKKHNNLDNLRGFPRESFDRILLDPPCSALGLRPKLGVSITAKDLKKAATYQRAFLLQAMDLLKPGGILTYSTCTINPMENEGNVAYMLRNFGDQLKLLPVPPDGLGQAGLLGSDLLEEERLYVKRFDPTDRKDDCMGFFLAKFQKRSTESHLCDDDPNKIRQVS